MLRRRGPQYPAYSFCSRRNSASVDIRVGFQALNPAQTNVIGSTSWSSTGQNFLPGTIVSAEDPAQVALIPLDGGDFRYAGYATSLLQVFEHELGHALGLGENPADPNAVMNPTSGPSNNAGPDQSDIQAIQSLYGAPLGASASVDRLHQRSEHRDRARGLSHRTWT